MKENLTGQGLCEGEDKCCGCKRASLPLDHLRVRRRLDLLPLLGFLLLADVSVGHPMTHTCVRAYRSSSPLSSAIHEAAIHGYTCVY